MNNSEEDNTENDKILLRNNGKSNTVRNSKETVVEINKCNEQINAAEVNESKNDIERKESVIVNLDIKFEDTKDKAKELEEKCNVFRVMGKGTKTIWVQFNQIYGKSSPRYGDDGGHGGGSFNYDPASRNYFVRFVFMILLVMLSITAAYGLLVLTTPELKEFYLDAGLFMMILSAGVLLAMNYVMVCSACARVPPCNFISLIIVVIAMSNLVAAVTARYKTNIIVFAVIATVITVAGCVLLACTSFDFTQWYIYVVAVAMVFMAIAMVSSMTMLLMGVRLKPLQLVLLFVGTLLQVVFLIMELQMILGGRAIEMEEDDYALAAYMLYTSIVDIFLHMVQMMGLLDQ